MPLDDDVVVNIKGAADDLRRATRQAVRDLKDVGDEARRQTAQGTVLRAENRRVASSFDEIGDQARQAAYSMGLYSREAGKVQIRSNGVSQGLRDVGVNLRAIGWTTALANIGPLSSGLLDAAAGAVALGSGLAPLGGLLAALPYGFGAAGQAAFAGSLAFNQVSEALKGNKDAIAALDPLQRQLVDRIKNDIAPEIQKLQGIAQEGILPGVNEALTDLVKLAPEAEKVLGRTSKVMGGLAKDAGNLIARPDVQRDLQRFGLANADLLDKLGHGGLAFADGLRHITMAAEPLVDHLGDLAEEGGKVFDKWAESKRKSGDLADFFDLTKQRVDQSLSILKDTGGVIGSLVSGSRPLADHIMDGLVEDMDKLNKLVSSPQGQSDLKAFFEGAKEPLDAVSGLLGDVVKDIGELGIDNQGNLTDLANTLDQKILPPVKDLADLISEKLLPHAIDLVGSLGHLADEVMPGLEPVADGVGHLADDLGRVLDFTAGITEDMPGIAKLVPSLALGAGTIAGWKAIRDVLSGNRGRGGKLGGVLDIAFGKGSLGTAANPMKVWVVNQHGTGPTVPDREPTPTPVGGTPRTPGRPSRIAGLATDHPVGTAGVLALGVSGFASAANVQNQPLNKLNAFARGADPTAVLHLVGLPSVTDLLPAVKKGWSSDKVIKNTQQALFGVPAIEQLKRAAGATPDRPAATNVGQGAGSYQALVNVLHPNGPLSGNQLGGKAASRDIKEIAAAASDATQMLEQTRRKIASLKTESDKLKAKDPNSPLVADYRAEIRRLETFEATLRGANLDKIAAPQWERMKDVAGKSMGAIARTTAQTTREIKDRLGSDTASGKDALAQNFRLAAQAVAKSMKDGEVSTSRGLAKIEEYMRKALAQYGITGKEATRYLNGQDTKKGTSLEGRPGNMAGGGLIPLGRPGAPGRDNIPLLLNGQPVMAAEGETVAVLNRHQRAKLDALAGRGGLSEFIKSHSRPNYMASGGIIEAANGVGVVKRSYPMVSGDTDFLPALGQALSAMARSTHTAISVTSGGRTMAEQAALYREKGAWSPTNPGAAAPSPSAPHIRGVAADISPGVSTFGSVAGQFGLGFPMGNEPWHIQLLNDAVGSALSAAGVAPTGDLSVDVPKLKRVMFQGGMGQLSVLGQAGLDRVRAAAQDKLASLLGGGIGGGGGGNGAALRKRFGLPAVFDDIRYAESRNDPNAHNPSGASGWYQIMMPLHAALVRQVAARLGRAPNVYDPVVNTAVAAELYHQAGLSPWDASKGLWAKAGSYASQGWMNAALGLGDITSLGDPKAPEKSKNAKKSKAAEKRRPKTNGPGRPDLSKVRPGRGRRGKGRQKPVAQWIKDMLIADGQSGVLGFLPDFDAVFEQPINSAESAINNLSSLFDLSQEQPTVTLYDSDQYPDLSNWLAAHPEDLAGAKTPAEFMERYGNGIEVVNQEGLTVQGQFVRGIAQRVDELHKLLAMHTGAEDGTGTSQLLGNRLAFLDAMSVTGPQALGAADGVVGSNLAQLAKARGMRREDLQDEIQHRNDLRQKGTPYTKRVALLNAQIDTLRQYKEDIGKAAIGHRLSDEGQRNRQWATDKISDLTNEVQALQAEYGNDPDARLLPDMPVKPSGKQATKRNLAAYREALAKWRRKQAMYLRALTKSNQQIDLDQRTLGVIQDASGQWTDRHQAITEKGQEFSARAGSLRDDEIPAQRLTITTLQNEIADLLNTRVAPRPIDTTGSTGQNGELADLLRQQNDELRKNFAISQAQYPVLQGIAGLVGQRVLGSFLHGTEYVPARGLYELHEGERVVPNPEGPFGNQITSNQSAAPVVNVELTVVGDIDLKRVDARIDGRAARVVDQQIGRKSRLIAAAPGGGR